jgi:YfiH family protein
MFSDNKYTMKYLISDCTGEIPCLQFDSLSVHAGLIHVVFSRKGGVSSPPYDSLNVSYNTGDLHDHVSKNLSLIKEKIGAGHMMSMSQVHGTDIITLHRDNCRDLSTRSADAIITDIPLLGIMVKQADCQGVILYDAVKSVVAAVHCGWRGNVQDILGAAVNRMRSEFGCNPEDMKAAIGPSLGPCCAEFTTYREIFPEEFYGFIVRDSHFDLWEISRMQLLRAGLMKDNIEIAGICTKCNTDIFYSYRGEGNTGRFGTVAMIKKSD